MTKRDISRRTGKNRQKAAEHPEVSEAMKKLLTAKKQQVPVIENNKITTKLSIGILGDK